MGSGFYIKVGATLAIFGFAVLLSLAALGFSDILLRAMNIPAMRPFFADLRTIPSLDQLTQYDNLRLENPVDPWGRPYNYPKVWAYLVEPFRICRDPYFCLGSLQFLIFLILAIGLIWRVNSPVSVFAIVILAVSPPITLLLERGNNDGFAFLLVLMSVNWYGPFRTPFFIALATGLKIFPAVALPIVFKPKNPFPYLLALAIASPLLVATLIDVQAILGATPVSAKLSYGIPSFAAWLGILAQKFVGLQFTSRVLILLSAIVLLCSVLLSYFLFRKAYYRLADHARQSPNRVYVLLVFGVIFLFTVLVFSNWAYRIVFLTPVAFQAMSWLFDERPKMVSDWFLLFVLNAALFGAFWSLLAPHGHILFNVVTFAAAALLYPLVTLVAIYEMATFRQGSPKL